jgi:hypothetical protein
LARFEFESETVSFFLSLFRSENHVCLSRGVEVVGAAWRAATRTVAGVGDLVQRTGDGRTGRVAPCAVCTWHVETRTVGFLVEPQNQGRRFVSGLASKPLRRFSPIWPQNRWRRFLVVWPQNLLRRILLIWPQNLWRRFSPVWPQNRWRRFLLVWPQNWRSVSWLSLKTKVVEGFPVWTSKLAALVW